MTDEEKLRQGFDLTIKGIKASGHPEDFAILAKCLATATELLILRNRERIENMTWRN